MKTIEESTASSATPEAGIAPLPKIAPVWDRFVENHPAGHLLQLTAWRVLKCRFGWEHSRVTVTQEQTVGAGVPAGTNDGVPHGRSGAKWIGGAEILYRRAFGLTLAYVPRGPVVDWRDTGDAARVLEAVEDTARTRGAALLKLEPQLLDSLDARSLLRDLGYTPSRQTVQPPSTIRIGLADDEAGILQRMKSKWRYNVRLAQRKGVSVREATADDLPVFNALMDATGSRDGFAVHSPDYYRAAFELLTPRHGVFLLAEYEGRPLAAIVVGLCGDTALYLWGASNNEERNRMPNHALQWTGMQWAKARGASWYDLWGVPDAVGVLALGMNRGLDSRRPVDDLPVDMEQLPGHDLWGVYRFKQGFGGEAVRYVGAWDKALSPVGGRVYALGLQARESEKVIRNWVIGHWRSGSLQSSAQVNYQLPVTNYQLPITTPSAWRATLSCFSAPHVLQSWEWGEIKAQTGWRAHRLAWTPEGKQAPTAAFQLLRRPFLPGLPWSIGYIPKGPVTDWVALDDPDALLAAVEGAARRLGCIFVKIDPDVREDSPVGKRLRQVLQRRGWRYSPNQIQFKNTAFTHLMEAVADETGIDAPNAGSDTDSGNNHQAPNVGPLGDEQAGDDQAGGHQPVDVQAVEEALLAGMKSKWRYNIRLAARRGIQVRSGSVVDLPLFYSLYAQTGARDGFLVRPYGYYLETWRAFLQAEQLGDNPAGGALLLAEHPDDREPVAGLFLMRYGSRAWYFYGASSERRRRDMPNYLLQWEALRWSVARGCSVYDWWGAPTNPDDPGDDMQGVWQFKQGFGVEFQPHIGAWDFPIAPRAYAVFTDLLPKALGLLRRL